MNRKILLLALMSGCCEVQASGTRKSSDSVVSDPFAGFAERLAGFLWNKGTTTSATEVKAVALEEAVSPVIAQETEDEVLAPVDPKVQVRSMIDYVFEVYQGRKTSSAASGPGRVTIKNIVKGKIDNIWSFSIADEKALKDFCSLFNKFVGVTNPEIREKDFVKIISCSNDLNGKPLSDDRLAAVIAAKKEQHEANVNAKNLGLPSAEERVTPGERRVSFSDETTVWQIVEDSPPKVSPKSFRVTSVAASLANLDAAVKSLLGVTESRAVTNWFLSNKDVIVANKWVASINGNLIQFGSSEDDLSYQIPGLTVEEEGLEERLSFVCSSLNEVAKAFGNE